MPITTPPATPSSTQPRETSAGCDRRRRIKVREEEYEVPCGSRYCASCGVRWMGDQRVQAVAASQELDGGVALITVTAPGRAWLESVARARDIRLRDVLHWWNAHARARWRRLHLSASRPVRAWAALHAPGWRVLFRSWEYQKRGALHLHLVMPYGTPEERRVTDLYVWNLWSAARLHGFGFVLGGDRDETPGWTRAPTVVPADGPAAARYVAKYVASTGAGKEGMVAVAQRTAQRGSILYVSPTLTRRSGVTMTSLRARRRIWGRYPRARLSRREWEVACLLDAVQAGRAPLTPEAKDTIRRLCLRTGATLWVDAEDGVAEAPTAAPAPLKAVEDRTPWAGPRRAVVGRLASVLLRDPDAPWLGPTRSALVSWEVVNV